MQTQAEIGMRNARAAKSIFKMEVLRRTLWKTENITQSDRDIIAREKSNSTDAMMEVTIKAEDFELENEIEMLEKAEFDPTDTTVNFGDGSKADLKSTENDMKEESKEEDGKDKILRILKDYAELFNEEISIKDTNTAPDMNIVLKKGMSLPPPTKMRRRAPKEYCAIKEWLDKMKVKGFVEAAINVPHAAERVAVFRKEKWRICHDYRALNDVTQEDIFPQKSADEIFASMEGCRFFSIIDTNSGYNQMKIAVEDRDKTAFKTMNGTYRMIVMPFGLKNAPSHFNRWLDKVLKNIKAQRYVDDIIIATKTLDDHFKILADVLEACRINGVKLRTSKCTFLKTSIKVLGHIVSADGLKPDPEKVKAIREYGKPIKVKELKSFLGLLSYYRKFCRMLAEDTKNLREISNNKKQNDKLIWTAD
jgi:hypothetical protein